MVDDGSFFILRGKREKNLKCCFVLWFGNIIISVRDCKEREE